MISKEVYINCFNFTIKRWGKLHNTDVFIDHKPP